MQSGSSPRPQILFTLAAIVAVATLAVWLSTGAHWGWTRTRVTEMRHDAITGIDFPVEHKKFVAGVEVLATGAGTAVILGATGAFLARRSPTS